MDTKDEAFFERWRTKMLERYSLREREAFEGSIVHDVLYAAFEQGYNKGYTQAEKDCRATLR